MAKIKISYLNESGEEDDYITRDIPKYNNIDTYNFFKGILFDLYLILKRNSSLYDFLEHQLLMLLVHVEE